MENRESTTTVIHLIGAVGSVVLWLLSALTSWWQLKKDDNWKSAAIITLIIPVGMVIARAFVSENAPRLSQRIAFASYYLFIIILALKLFFTANKNHIPQAV